MRTIVATILSMSLVASERLTAAEIQPLSPGKPAGVAVAQIDNHQLFVVITLGGTAAMVAAALLLMKKKKSDTAADAGTSATATTP